MPFESQELFYYWSDKVSFRNHSLITSPHHVETYKLRHECTNYDQLWQSQEVQQLSPLERDRAVAIIKYECTSKVLQQRASALRNQVSAVHTSLQDVGKEKSRLLQIIRKFQEMLFGKDQEIEQLKAKLAEVSTDNRTLRIEVEQSKAYAELRDEFDKLQKDFDKVSKRRKELAKNNQSLGGRVAHTKRFRRERDEARQERDEAREILAAHKEQIEQLQQLNKTLTTENEQMKMQLSRLQPAKG